MDDVPFRYGGARAMTLLHETHMQSFLKLWQEAKKERLRLPESSDPDYKTLISLLAHVLDASRGYMIWMCDNLGLPDPKIKALPETVDLEREADRYLAHLLERWRLPLVNLEEKYFFAETYSSTWGVEYCIDAMLEHAVMHPIRHEFQLKNLLAAKAELSV